MRIYLNLDFKEFIKRNSAELIRNIRDLSQVVVGIDNLLKVISESIILIVILFFLSSVSFKSYFFI